VGPIGAWPAPGMTGEGLPAHTYRVLVGCSRVAGGMGQFRPVARCASSPRARPNAAKAGWATDGIESVVRAITTMNNELVSSRIARPNRVAAHAYRGRFASRQTVSPDVP